MVKVLQRGGAYMNESNWTVYLIDTAEDLTGLPNMTTARGLLDTCASGSVAMSADGSIIAM